MGGGGGLVFRLVQDAAGRGGGGAGGLYRTQAVRGREDRRSGECVELAPAFRVAMNRRHICHPADSNQARGGKWP